MWMVMFQYNYMMEFGVEREVTPITMTCTGHQRLAVVYYFLQK